MKYTIFILTLLFVPLSVAKNYGDLNVSEIVSIYDGDTFRVNLDGVSLSNLLLKQNLAVKYDGGKKVKNWCK